MSGFVHLHLHTEYSLLDGVCRIGQLCNAASELGQTAVAVTDHGAMYGAMDFYKAAKKAGIKPIIGCEVYVAARTRFDKSHAYDSERYHLILLCENNVGYSNLIKIVSKSWTEGFYTKPRVDMDLLREHSEGIIALSACIAGEIPRAVLRGDMEAAREIALRYRNIFGKDNFFLEIQDHGLEEEMTVLRGLKQLSAETGIHLVATNDTHYLRREDAKVQQVLICVQTNHLLGEDTGLEFESDEFYLRSESEMRSLFAEVPQAIDNTVLIAERCNVEFEFGKTKLPNFDTPDGSDHFEWFKAKCQNGLNEKFDAAVPPEYQSRLDYELGVIDRMGYTDYYLIVHDFISFAKSKGIPVGPGRGSGAGSLAAYAIGITGIDPIKYNLLFERFLNPERVSMPDFDIDFCFVRRPEVIDYVIGKYGSDHVAQIITFGTLAAKAALRDVARVMGVPYSTADRISKLVSNEPNITLESALKRSEELRHEYETNDMVRELVDMAKRVEGMPRHASKHAAGVVITKDPVDDYVPLALSDEDAVTQYTMTTLEELGLLKMDFLGLRTLTVIDDAVKMIRKKQPDFCIESIEEGDAKTYKMLSNGLTEGVFQFESAGMRSVLTKLKPTILEDLIAVISLYRPGPMDSIDTYIENRHHPERTSYRVPQLKSLLDVTSGCMIYQEQVMQIFRELAGYSYGRADVVRRAMSKKKHDVMEKERASFISGAAERGIACSDANAIFDDMTSFASYAFNKSHAAAYSLVSYRTAYLKCRYPAEFMCALLTSVLDSSVKISRYIAECERLSIKVLSPSVNYSDEDFSVDGKTIRFGLLAIKNLGRAFISAVISERKIGGNYTSFYSFCKRCYGRDFNRRAVESLIYSGALDGLGTNRRQMMIMLPGILADLENNRSRNLEGQIGFFDLATAEAPEPEPQAPAAEELPKEELLEKEKGVLGIYLSGHPMAEYAEISRGISSVSTLDLNEAELYKDNDRVLLLALIAGIKKKVTKSNNTIAFLTLEDMYGSIEALVFPKILEDNYALLAVGNVIVVHGRLSLREDREPSLVCDVIESVSKPNTEEKKKRKGIFIRLPSRGLPLEHSLRNIAEIFDGTMPLYFYYCDEKKYQLFSSKAGVFPNEPMLKEMRRLVGADNVIVQE